MEFEKKLELGISAKEAFDLFCIAVWEQGGGLGRPEWTQIVEKGDPQTRIGQVRRVPGGEREKIVHVALGTKIEYQVLDSKIFRDHLATVQFIDLSLASEIKCQIIWQVRCSAMFGMGIAVKFMIDVALNRMLDALKEAATSNASPK